MMWENLKSPFSTLGVHTFDVNCLNSINSRSNICTGNTVCKVTVVVTHISCMTPIRRVEMA